MSDELPWCNVCCTRHTPGKDCPGALLATGPERHARKFSVTQDRRLEYYGVLIAESDELWRARVFTYPNMLWSVPGGRGTVKFVGTTAKQAEDEAIAFLREHCEERRYSIQDATNEVIPGQVDEERDDSAKPKRGKEPRHPCKVPIRFGEEKATETATTANLSVGGIYIATSKVVHKGRSIKMLLDVRAYTIPLTGTVAWVRNDDEEGRPRGIGVAVHNPPSLFVRYVTEVREKLGADSKPADQA